MISCAWPNVRPLNCVTHVHHAVLENEEEDDASSSASDDAGDVASLLDADPEEDPVALRHMCGVGHGQRC